MMKSRILMAVDGSDQALEAVRYLCSIVSPDRTRLVLFNVGSGFPEVFWDLDRNPLYQSKKTRVMGWLADQQHVIGEFREKAQKIVSDAGFTAGDVEVKTQARGIGVLKSIIRESYMDYSAVVLGRTGICSLKDRVVGSIAGKLAERIKHVPTVVVAGRPESHRILIALDESIEAMRGVTCIGALAGAGDPEFTLCHCFGPRTLSLIDPGPAHAPREVQDRAAYYKNKFRPYMDEAALRLVDSGIDEERISREFVFTRGNAIRKLIETATSGGFGTMVVGRREAVNISTNWFRNRFSDFIIKKLDNMAVWVSH